MHHPKLVILCAVTTAVVLADVRTAEAGCWFGKTRCTTHETFRGLAMELNAPAIAKTRGNDTQNRQRNYTVSTQGQTRNSAMTKKTELGQSPFVLSKGSDGDIGDIALGVGDGGRVTMDVREDFLKIQYTMDF